MLGKMAEHDILVALIGNKDVARGLDSSLATLQGTQRNNVEAGAGRLIDESTARLARIAKDARFALVLVDIVIALDNGDLTVIPHAKLHSRSSKLAALLAVAPHGQFRVTGDLFIKNYTKKEIR